MVQERHESTIEVGFDTSKGEASLNRLQSRLDRLLATARNASQSLGGGGFGGGGIPGGGGIYGPRPPGNATGMVGGHSGTVLDPNTGLYVPERLLGATGAGGGAATSSGGGGGGGGGGGAGSSTIGSAVMAEAALDKTKRRNIARGAMAMGAISMASNLAQQEAIGYRAEYSGQVTRRLRQQQAARRATTSAAFAATGAAVGAPFGPAGIFFGGLTGGAIGGIYDIFAGAREDSEIAAVEARSQRASQLAEIHRSEGLARFMGGLVSGPGSRNMGAQLGFGAAQSAALQNQFARAAGGRIRGTLNTNIFNVAAMGGDVGAMGRFEGMGVRGITSGNVGSGAFRLFNLAQQQGLRGSEASNFVSRIGGVAENMRSQFGVRMSGAALESDIANLAGAGLSTTGLTQAFGGFRQVGAGVANDMFGGLAQGIARDASFMEAAQRSSSIGDLFENLRNQSASALNRGIGALAGNNELADITRAITGSISMDEARGLRGMGTADLLQELPAELPPELRASLRGASTAAMGQTELLNRLGGENMNNLLEATNRAASAMDRLAEKVDTLKL